MANYDTLKTSVQNVIKQNGNNEITGSLLQQTLLAIINSLGAGYQFAGVAVPSTNPGTPDQKMFYIAGPGTYPNFDGAIITKNQVGIFYYDSDWHTSRFGNYADADDLQRAFAVAWFDSYNDVPNAGGFVNQYGKITVYELARYTDYIQIIPGKEYFLKRPFVVDAAFVAVYNANKVMTRTFGASSLVDGDLTFVAGENEYFLRVSYQAGNFPKYVSVDGVGPQEIVLDDNAVKTNNIENGAVTFEKLATIVQNLFAAYPVNSENVVPGYVSLYGGIGVLSGAYATDYLSVKPGLSFTVFSPFVIDNAAIALYDKNKTFIRSISETEVGRLPKSVTIMPSGEECFMRVSFQSPNIPNIILVSVDKSTFPGGVFKTAPVIDGAYIGTGGEVVPFPGAAVHFAYTDYIELPTGIAFRVVNKTIDSASFAIYNSNKSVSRVILSTDVAGMEFIPFTLSGDEKYIRATLRENDVCDVMLNEIISNVEILRRAIQPGSSAKEYQYNVLAGFDNIVCVGDSLTYSQVYTAQSASRQAFRPYPTVLGKLCGNEATILAQAGATAKACWDLFGAQVVSKTNPLAIIYLGTNYGITDTLDTDVVGDNPDNWADNNIGCYCRFVQKFQSLGYKVLLLKCWATSGSGSSNLANTNAAITHIGQRFGCAVMAVPVSDAPKFHFYPDLSGSNGVHYNDLGYSWFASALIANVSDLPDNEMKYIIPNA